MPVTDSRPAPYQVEDFVFDLRTSVAPAEHLWVNSGYGTVAPLPDTVLGVRGCYSPPFAAADLGLTVSLSVAGTTIEDTGSTGKGDCGLLYAGGEWLPDRIRRRGTYHWRTAGETVSLGVRSDLVPLTGRAGFLLVVRVVNRGDRPVPLRLTPTVTPGRPDVVPLSDWGFGVPAGDGGQAVAVAPGVWENDRVRVTAVHDLESDAAARSVETLSVDALAPADEAVFRLAVVLTPVGEEAAAEPAALDAWDRDTGQVWQRRLDRAGRRVPRVRSDIPGLEAYYRRSLISGLVCEWEHPDFALAPFVATGGMDGGAICAYVWDNAGYSGQLVALLLGDRAVDQARLLAALDLDRRMFVAPDGSGGGVWYSFSLWALFHLVWSIIVQYGIGAELFPLLRDRLLAEERRLPEHHGLLDYGGQPNLLEMRGTGYEHVVSSPNAERAWCFDRLADLADHLGEPGADGWRATAASIRGAIREHLWDPERGWFRSLHPDGHAELVYSIRAYTAIRMGACTPEMTEAILSHLRDGAFLGEYGVSSVSAEDELHYELLDPDWSGGGAYTGEGPNLAQTLWEAGHPDLAWTVLRRHLWMGRHLPYFPQEHYSDRPATPAHKRANIVSGICGAQAVVYGMAGIQPRLDGSLWVRPHPPGSGEVDLAGYPFRGHRIDVRLRPGHCTVACDGRIVHDGPPAAVQVVPPGADPDEDVHVTMSEGMSG